MFGFFKKDKVKIEKVEEIKEEKLQQNINSEENKTDIPKTDNDSQKQDVKKSTEDEDPDDDFPDEVIDNRPLLKIGENGKPIIPLDKENKPVVNIDDNGKPILELDETNKPIIPLDESGNPYFAIEENGSFAIEPPPPPPPEISIRVTPDNTSAFIKVKTFTRSQSVTADELYNLIESNGIKYGIKNDAINAFCAKKRYSKELLIAQGKQPVDCKDGFIEYFFKTDFQINLIENEKGLVNYRELGLIQNVQKGQKLCIVHKPTEGTNGRSIFDDAIMPKPGKEQAIRLGENVQMADNQTDITATIAGCVDLIKDVISVSDVFSVKGDVNAGIGNLDCEGSVIVGGDVHEGFTVKAAKNIIVKGCVEGANLIAGGDINIQNGMNGMNIGTLHAGGNIISKYIENAFIDADENIMCDVIMNTDCKAKKKIILKGGKGAIIGGESSVGEMLYANFIGSHTNVPTIISIDSEALRKQLTPAGTKVFDDMTKVKAQILNEQEHLKRIEQQVKTLNSQQSTQEIKDSIKNLNNEETDANAKIDDYQAKIEEMLVEANELYKYKVVALKTCFAGVKLNIAYLYKNMDNDYNNVKFFADGHTITDGAVLPSDKL